MRTSLFFIVVHITLLIPGFVLLRRFTRTTNNSILLSGSYALSTSIYFVIALLTWLLNLSHLLVAVVSWCLIVYASFLFIKYRYYTRLLENIKPLVALILISLLAVLFVNLKRTQTQEYIPDPKPLAQRNYSVINVKILNLAHTNANDNYIPYRQAQFFYHRLNLNINSFIDEWGVHFFQRTPFMGGVTAFYMDLFRSKPPIDYLWSTTSIDPNNSYGLFQVLASILNSLFILPSYFLLKRLFNNKTATISLLFLITNAFFLHSNFYTWPKSLVAFFVLFSWLLIIEKRTARHTVFAGAILGIAYLVHDLAILYTAATLIYLFLKKRYRDIAIISAASLIFIIPWLIVGRFIYNKSSTFYLYPFSTNGIPSSDNFSIVFYNFMNTSIWRLVTIRLQTLYYLLTPYPLFSGGKATIWERLWAVGVFTIPGALGLGLVIPSVLGCIKKLKKSSLLALLAVPIILVALIFGWSYPGSIGAFHFAQPIVVLLVGSGVWYLLTLKKRFWLKIVYASYLVYVLFFIAYSYNFSLVYWSKSVLSILSFLGIIFILFICAYYIFKEDKLALQE